MSSYTTAIQLWKDRGIVDLRYLSDDEKELFIDQMGLRVMYAAGVLDDYAEEFYE